jgi:hypothetical protein
MLSKEEIRSKFMTELTADDPKIRASYLKHFGAEVEEFSDAMTSAFMNWRSLDVNSEKDNRHAYVSAIVYTAISLHIQSLKAFLSGLSVPAGNLMRQTLETIALALLCSGKDLGVLDRFMAQKYSTNYAIGNVIRKVERLGLEKEGVEALREGQKFYHNYSHPTHLTMAAAVKFSDKGIAGLYVGAAFDERKLEVYRKEVAGRLSLARAFSGFIDGVKVNVAKW